MRRGPAAERAHAADIPVVLEPLLARGFEAIGDLVEPSGEGVGERAVGVVADVPDAGIVDRAVLVEAVDAAPGVDLDGDLDLYVTAFGPNVLYENRGDGTFLDVTEASGVQDSRFSAGASWADFDRDGWMDLYVANMFSSAGHRITDQAKFRRGDDQQIRQRYRRFAKGNTLFQNLRDGTFREIGAEANVEMGRWAWSSPFLDINNDGWEDIVVANGFLTTEDTGDL